MRSGGGRFRKRHKELENVSSNKTQLLPIFLSSSRTTVVKGLTQSCFFFFF